VSAFAVGLTYLGVVVALGGSAPSSSPADVGYLLFYPLMLAALFVAVRHHSRGLASSVWLDCAVGSLARPRCWWSCSAPCWTPLPRVSSSLATALAVRLPDVGPAASSGPQSPDWRLGRRVGMGRRGACCRRADGFSRGPMWSSRCNGPRALRAVHSWTLEWGSGSPGGDVGRWHYPTRPAGGAADATRGRCQGTGGVVRWPPSRGWGCFLWAPGCPCRVWP